MSNKTKRFFESIIHHIYYRGIRRLIPKYHDRTIFTAFYWRTWWDRRTKGFDESETWSLDYSLSKLIAPRIKMFMNYCDFAIPYEFLDAEHKKSIAKGYKWDNRRWELESKAERKRCWKRATDQWKTVLQKIYDGFADDLLENDDWDAWNSKWKSAVDKVNKKLDKAKTEVEKKEIWNEIKAGRDYRKGITCCTDDIVYNLRKESRLLLAEYYNNLWW